MLPFSWLLPTTKETIWILPLLLLYFGTLLCLMPELILWSLPGELGCRGSLSDAELHSLQGFWMSKDRDCSSAGASYVRGLGTDLWGEKAENISEKSEYMLAGYREILCYKYYWTGNTPGREQLYHVRSKTKKTLCLNHCTVHCHV